MSCLFIVSFDISVYFINFRLLVLCIITSFFCAFDFLILFLSIFNCYYLIFSNIFTFLCKVAKKALRFLLIFPIPCVCNLFFPITKEAQKPVPLQKLPPCKNLLANCIFIQLLRLQIPAHLSMLHSSHS